MHAHKIVTRDEWLQARKALLAKEKEMTRQRDLLSEQRRALPWVKVEKAYAFETTAGRKTLAGLFGDKNQLIVYHFMWRHDLDDGCIGCSFLADHIDGANLHLPHNDVALVVVSRAPLAVLQAYRKRMGWRFEWVSSAASDFNFDYHVSFTRDELAKGKVTYNYTTIDASIDELSGISAFCKDDNGDIFHTYSSYGRGNEEVLGAYMWLDLAPKGRNENGPHRGMMDWVRHHDRYEAAGAPDKAGGWRPAAKSGSDEPGCCS